MEDDAYEISEQNVEYENGVALRSIALSLKRIADALEKKPVPEVEQNRSYIGMPSGD